MRLVMRARVHLLILLLAAFGWVVGTSYLLMPIIGNVVFGPLKFLLIALATVPAMFAIAAMAMAARLPVLASRANVYPARALGLLSLAGITGGLLGAFLAFESQTELPAGILILVWAIEIPIAVIAIAMIRVSTRPALPRFLLDRTHAANGSARRCLVVIAVHAIAVTVAVERSLEFPGQPGRPEPFPQMLFLFGASYAIGILLSLLQAYPHRALGLVPYAALLAVVGFLAGWIAPQTQWPVALLGFAAGLVHVGPRAWLILLVPESQRGGAAFLAFVASILGIGLGCTLILVGPASALSPLRVVAGIAILAAAMYWFFREFFEQTLELVLPIFYPIRGYGPGLTECPMRGPTLVIANHCAWLDPPWVSKVIPLQLRPLMTSRFFDLPVSHFLMTRVFHAIRVPDVGFRREAPEIHEAIAALDNGENVLIFPEGWLRRKEEQAIRRFGQGVYQILREKPQTPVVACWIEGSWGSYTSYFNGPPTKNKKMDWFRRIRVGVSAPEVLSLELLLDNHQTRRFLMQAVLDARAHIGLEALPGPAYMGGESDEAESE